MGVAVAKKTRAFEEWLQRSDRVTFDRKKQTVKVTKRMADWQWKE